MKKEKLITFAAYLCEGFFGTLAVAQIFNAHPVWATVFLALARTSQAAKEFLLKEQNPRQNDEG